MINACHKLVNENSGKNNQNIIYFENNSTTAQTV